jgi:hypothetical protein
MKPDFRISLTITALLIVVALAMPPWKDTFNGQFTGFYYVFSEKGASTIQSRSEIDYGRLTIEVIGIIFITIAIHSIMLMPLVNNYLIKVRAFIEIILKPIVVTFRFIDKNLFLIRILLLAVIVILGFR